MTAHGADGKLSEPQFTVDRVLPILHPHYPRSTALIVCREDKIAEAGRGTSEDTLVYRTGIIMGKRRAEPTPEA
jgi:hypothetical protein